MNPCGQIAVCIGCGCDDNHACPDGCWWLRVDYHAGSGVCSACEDHTEAWDRGDRTQHAEHVVIEDALLTGEIRIERPEQQRPTDGKSCRHDWPYEDVQESDTCRWCGMSFIRHVFTEYP